MTMVLLDSDIGSDVDDALALSVLLGSPEVDLVGVTTVYGDTTVRARLAARLIDLATAGKKVPVIPGAQMPLSGRPVWWAGHEGKAFDDLDTQPISQRRDAAEFLAEAAAAHPGQISLLAIGPLTNIANAMRIDPAFARNIGHLHVMGGHFGHPAPAAEHNIICDVDAAREVFDSAMPITVTGLEITTQLQLGPDSVKAIAQAGALGSALEREIDQWWKFHGHHWNNPHDPIAALTLIMPMLFKSTAHDIEVSLSPGTLAATTMLPSTLRATAVIDHIDISPVKREIVDRITQAGA